MKSIDFRGVRITGASPVQMTAALVNSIAAGRPLRVSFVNPHSFNILKTTPRLRDDLRSLDVVCVDGIGVCWVVRFLTGTQVDRLSFDLLAPVLFRELARTRSSVYLLGGHPGAAAEAARVIGRLNPGLAIVGYQHGYLLDSLLDQFAEEVRRAGASLLVIGAGAPRQERLVVELGDRLPTVSIVTCGGYFDQIVRPTPYYPGWAYPLRLNWLVRLAKEPRRLWRRYLVGTPRFVLDSIGWRLHELHG